MLDRVLSHLERLVCCDTRNPPGAVTAQSDCVVHAGGVLDRAGFSVRVDDLGEGCVNIVGIRGTPEILVNCHLDTVPAAEGWTGDPLTLRREADRVIGLGACDVKGSAACVLANAESTEMPLAVLLTTDEEAGRSRCVRTFLEDPGVEFGRVLVCEPTGSRVVRAHRGLVSLEATFGGESGHGSAGGRSALHDAVRWCAALLDEIGSAHRLNIGVIEGGRKANMVADSARVVVGLRPEPGADMDQLLGVINAALPAGSSSMISERFRGPSLDGTPGGWPVVDGIPEGGPVDFWTEASLFAAAGHPAIVFGAGDITQAHAADEYVTIEQLELCAARLQNLITAGAALAH